MVANSLDISEWDNIVYVRCKVLLNSTGTMDTTLCINGTMERNISGTYQCCFKMRKIFFISSERPCVEYMITMALHSLIILILFIAHWFWWTELKKEKKILVILFGWIFFSCSCINNRTENDSRHLYAK